VALERGLEMITEINTKSGRHPRKPVEFGSQGQRVNRTSGFKRQVLRQQQDGVSAAGSKSSSEGSEEENSEGTSGQASDVSLPPPPAKT
jgi:hypothetical protein